VASLTAQTPNIADLQRQARAGNAEAQFELAKAYLGGSTGVATDPKQGIEWLKKSALRGYSGAQVVLGVFYQKGFKQNGVEIPQDVHEAAKWYRKAAGQTSKDAKTIQNAKNAQTNLSEMLSQGLISKQETDWHVSEPTREAKKGKPAPFSIAEVETGLTGGITSKRMATLVNTYGVDFSLSATNRKRLTDDGADDNLLTTISSSKRSF
jgi:uncharacterized glyoxalase superfamily protein PhnB